MESNGETTRNETSGEMPVRGSRWPAIARSNRTTPSDEKIRRTQVFHSLTISSGVSLISISSISSLLFMDEVGDEIIPLS